MVHISSWFSGGSCSLGGRFWNDQHMILIPNSSTSISTTTTTTTTAPFVVILLDLALGGRKTVNDEFLNGLFVADFPILDQTRLDQEPSRRALAVHQTDNFIANRLLGLVGGTGMIVLPDPIEGPLANALVAGITAILFATTV